MIGQISLNYVTITKSISKIFIPNFVFVLTNKRYKNYIEKDFCSDAWVNFPGVILVVVWVPRGHVAYQIYWDDERNRIQVKFLS